MIITVMDCFITCPKAYYVLTGKKSVHSVLCKKSYDYGNKYKFLQRLKLTCSINLSFNKKILNKIGLLQ